MTPDAELENSAGTSGRCRYLVCMSRTFESIEKDAMQLPMDQKVTLAHRILTSAEPPSEPAIDMLWNAEIVARIERLDRGETGTHEASMVFAELDKRLAQ